MSADVQPFNRVSWIAAMLAVAATYFFFLIFAEFAFLHLASAVTTDGSALRWIMLGLGTGGVGGAALAARVSDHNRARALAWGFVACAVSAAAALAASTFPLLLATSVAIGLSLGWATVTLAASLRRATGDAQLGLCIGAGTGLAYAGCNIPAVFHAPPSTQALLAGVIVAAAAFLPVRLGASAGWPYLRAQGPIRRAQGRRARPPFMRLSTKGGSAGPSADDRQPADAPVRLAARSADPARVVEYDVASVVRWTAILMALVWMDSAAFYIVQHTGPLQAATWREPAALWSNAAVHLVVALGGGALLDRGRRGILAVGALAALALACLVLGGKLPPAFRPGWFYSAGVSAYSALLVEYPARSGRASTAAIVFAVAGWFGSALGIGMAQDLNHIPVSFVLAAAALLMAALGWRIRALRRAIAAIALLGVVSAKPLRAGETDVIARGREVYIAEGCIHCHSQYVRRRSAQDIAWWGPATLLSDALTASPPLFGTRRQGPDLSNVGSRRSAEWNRLHLIAPQEISPGSRMPSYAHLFAGAGSAGDALVTYLGSLGRDAIPARLAQSNAWSPDPSHALDRGQSRALFLQLCAHCHGPRGRGDGRLADRLSIRPPDWTGLSWRRVPPTADVETALSRIIKFGVPGTPMAGHEYLPDAEIVGLARFVQTLHSPGGAGPTVAARR